MRLTRHRWRHPSQQMLYAYAENQVDGGAPVSAAMAAHITACPRCSKEVNAIRAGLEFAASAPPLEPSRELAPRILLAAAKQRAYRSRSRRRRSTAWLAFRALAYTASMAVVAIIIFSVALSGAAPAGSAAATVAVEKPASRDLTVAKSIEKTTAEIETLAAAVRFSSNKSQTPHERRYLRRVNAIDEDINAALSALKRNPGCVRASHIVHANLERQAKTLRTLYAERTL